MFRVLGCLGGLLFTAFIIVLLAVILLSARVFAVLDSQFWQRHHAAVDLRSIKRSQFFGQHPYGPEICDDVMHDY